ncbi:PRC-barrel domain-containing protein [Salipaludibacillus sp. CUR1]|uniref:PRC-barrel domain-containing protein n=1 Tax=Salipaludibacillus sp. CUR1 TaxID=2820003 RepID=UPI001E54008C|nr:PRC-barrel domain-containing protein [Salipaludibacillus sp. CUR1]MCE7790927.1 PRC-barrel domain-containing protein [Salipaludibacillus sp. CUR1]
MRTFDKVKGAPVFCGKTNCLLGVISDLTYCSKEGRITGYWIQNHQWWSRKHVLPIKGNYQRTKKGFFIHRNQVLTPLDDNERRFFHGKDRMIGKPVVKQDGDMVGIVEDVYFLPNSGRILGYELTEGLFEDFKRGIMVKKTGDSGISFKGSSLLIH